MPRKILLLGLLLALPMLATVRAGSLEELLRDLDVVVGVASHGPLLALAGDGGGRILIVEVHGEEVVEIATFASPLPRLQPGPDALALALSTDTLLVGAGFGDSAALYVDTERGWHLEALLRGSAGSGYGAAVAVSGERMAIGAPFASGPGGEQGAVHLFRRTASQWSSEARLALPDGRYGDRFGASLAFDEGTIAVGAPGRSLGSSRSGIVALFAIDGDRPLASERLEPLPDVPAVGFGTRLAAGADRLFVAGDDAWGGEVGAVHVYARNDPAAELPLLLGWGGVGSADLHGTSLLLSHGHLAVAGRRELDEERAELYIALYGWSGAEWRMLQRVDVGVTHGDRRPELADLGSELLVVVRAPDPTAQRVSVWWRVPWP